MTTFNTFQPSFLSTLGSCLPKGIVVVSCVGPSVLLTVSLFVCQSVCTKHGNFLRISDIFLKFKGVMYSAMKQISIWNGYAQPILAFSQEFSSFPWKAWLATSEEGVYCSDSLQISDIHQKFDEVMHITMMKITRKHHPSWPGFAI